MTDNVQSHYAGTGDLIHVIAEKLQAAGKSLDDLTAKDLGAIDEFHVRGRKATLELGSHMDLSSTSKVLDIGSGLGGPARTIAETYGCHVTGIDLTHAFCDAATAISGWLHMNDQVTFMQGDATDLPFGANTFDAAMTIHVGMNIPAKGRVYAHAHRVLKPGGIFVVYDIFQGEGGEIIYPVPWAREPSISHVVTAGTLRTLLGDAGFEILSETDSTEESRIWFDERVAVTAKSGPPTLSFQAFLGDDFKDMAKSQVRNLTEKRIGTVTFVCRA
jgi:ubiquinone/menaquinone biosynthesis C-methylase UbiE